jgi:hypothetical protein
MTLTAAEKKKLKSMGRRAKTLESKARKLGDEVSKELVKQMKKS